jgi:hypothetical protein
MFGNILKTLNDGKDMVKLNMEIDKKKSIIIKTITDEFESTNDFNKEAVIVLLNEMRELIEERDGKKEEIKNTIEEGKNNLRDTANNAKNKIDELKNKNKDK